MGEDSDFAYIIPDLGFTGWGDILSGLIADPLGGAFTLVAEYSFIPAPENAGLASAINAGGAGNNVNYLVSSSYEDYSAASQVVQAFDELDFGQAPIAPGHYKLAITFDNGTVRASYNGQTVYSSTTDSLVIQFIAFDGSLGFPLEKLAFYPVADAATLQALSA
jgi:hypothetical protein